MTPLEILAAARVNPIDPRVFPKTVWLFGWVGPCSPVGESAIDVATRGGRIVDAAWRGEQPELRVDTRLREVQHLLIDHGCPPWALGYPPAALAFGMGVTPRGILSRWTEIEDSGGAHVRHLVVGQGRPRLSVSVRNTRYNRDRLVYGMAFSNESAWLGPWSIGGQEVGEEGRACADVAAIRAGFVLDESTEWGGGWYLPLRGGGVGWMERTAPPR